MNVLFPKEQTVVNFIIVPHWPLLFVGIITVSYTSLLFGMYLVYLHVICLLHRLFCPTKHNGMDMCSFPGVATTLFCPCSFSFAVRLGWACFSSLNPVVEALSGSKADP